MKRDLIYLALIVAAITAVKVTARTTPETPAEIRPLRIEAGFTKTVHILFPSPVTYIDIGSMDIIAGKADGAENVVRVKAAVRNFAAETNLTVITEDGGFFTFDVHYAENPVVSTLNLTVQEPQTEGVKKPAAAGYPQPTAPASEGRVLLREVGREKPATIKRMLSDIYRQNRTDVKGIRTKKYGIEVEVLGIYVSNDVIYIHTCTVYRSRQEARKAYGTAADTARNPARMQRSGRCKGTSASADGIRAAQAHNRRRQGALIGDHRKEWSPASDYRNSEPGDFECQGAIK